MSLVKPKCLRLPRCNMRDSRYPQQYGIWQLEGARRMVMVAAVWGEIAESGS
jgi:hypothetical protein